MHGTRAVRTFRTALIALVGVLSIFVGAGNAYAGGSDHGNSIGHQKWALDEGQQSGGQWDSQKSDDESWSDDSKSGNNQDCKQNESSTGEKTAEQPPAAPQGTTGGEQGGEQKGEQGGEQKGEETQKGEHGKKEEENKGENQGGEKSQGGSAPTPAPTPTSVVTTPAPAPAPVQVQQTPVQGGEVQGESQESPAETGGSSPKRGGRVLASNETTTPTASESSLAATGFGAWQLALLGILCVAGSALLLRRTRRS